MDCIQKIAVLLARVRHCLPRYMFQRLQTTTVKVSADALPQSVSQSLTETAVIWCSSFHFARFTTDSMHLCPSRGFYSMLEKSLKMLEFAIKNLRPLKGPLKYLKSA